MTWTAGVDKTTGTLVTAANWNSYLGVTGSLMETAPAKVTTAGDLVYATGANALARLAAGTSSQVLVGGTVPSWGAVPLAALGAAPSCRAHRTTTLSIGTSHTTILFDSESGDWDNATLHDTSSNTNRFTAPLAGVYAFFCSASISYGAGNTNAVLQARDASGNGLARSNGVPNATNAFAECTVAGQVKLAAAGWIDFSMAVNGSGTGTLQADGVGTPCKAGMTWLGTG